MVEFCLEILVCSLSLLLIKPICLELSFPNLEENEISDLQQVSPGTLLKYLLSQYFVFLPLPVLRLAGEVDGFLKSLDLSKKDFDGLSLYDLWGKD